MNWAKEKIIEVEHLFFITTDSITENKIKIIIRKTRARDRTENVDVTRNRITENI